MPLTAASSPRLHCLPTSKNWTQVVYLLEKVDISASNCGDPDQTPITAGSALEPTQPDMTP